MVTPHTAIDRRTFCASSLVTGATAALGTVGTPRPLETQPSPKWVFGPHGEIQDVPANRELLHEIDRVKPLNPHQLLDLAARTGRNPSQRELACKLFVHGMFGLSRDSSVRAAMQTIKDRQMPWSFWSDVWNAVAGAAISIDEAIFGSMPSNVLPCEIKCALVLLVQKCPNDKSWSVIGICFGASF